MDPWVQYGMTEVEWLRVANQALRTSREYWYGQAVVAREDSEELRRELSEARGR